MTREATAAELPRGGNVLLNCESSRAEVGDALRWLVVTGTGLGLTALAVHSGVDLGTAGAPFLGRFRLQLTLTSLLAPLVAAAVLAATGRGMFDRARWPIVLIGGYAAALAWTLALALADGADGLTRALRSPDEYGVDVGAVGADPIGYVRDFTAEPGRHSAATRGHPPGPVLLLWAMQRPGLTDPLVTGVLIAAVGALAVPLVLATVRGVCGEAFARRYAPVLVLAPYAVWLAVSMDAVVALLGAALIAAGARASAPGRGGWRAAGWAVVAGLLIGVAALFSYAAPWLALSLVLLYFARRRAVLNLVTGAALLIPIGTAQALGFGWVDGLLMAQADHASRIGAHRPVLWWAGVSLVALLLATGPALVASARKLRNTPGWPFLAGAAVAVLFSVLAGLARGGVEHAWLPFFPWLTLAVVGPHRPGGPPPAAPLLLTGLGAATAVVIEAVLSTPW